jgi:hypothetical protein
MATVAAIIGVVATVMGIVGVLSPALMRRFAEQFHSPAALYAGQAARILIGILLIVAGSYCRPDSPWVGYVVRVIGVVAIIVAVALIVRGPNRAKNLIDRWTSSSDATVRGTMLIVLLVGGILIYAGM